MTLHLIGIGYKKEDITIEQKKVIEKCENVFSEFEKFLKKKIEICKRYKNFFMFENWFFF